jgi:hypothetical protein
MKKIIINLLFLTINTVFALEKIRNYNEQIAFIFAKIYFINIIKQATTGLYFNKMKVDEVFVFETPKIMNLERRKAIINMLLEYITGIQARLNVI